MRRVVSVGDGDRELASGSRSRSAPVHIALEHHRSEGRGRGWGGRSCNAWKQGGSEFKELGAGETDERTHFLFLRRSLIMSEETTCMWTCLYDRKGGQCRRDGNERKERARLMLSTAWKPMLMGQTHPCFFIISSSIIS